MELHDYKLYWPGMQDLPIVIMDPDTKLLYNRKAPLPLTLNYLNSIEFKYADIKDVMSTFSGNQRVKARKVCM